MDDELMCSDCGDMTPFDEIVMHGGVCKCCYDDNHFGDEPPYGDEEE